MIADLKPYPAMKDSGVERPLCIEGIDPTRPYKAAEIKQLEMQVAQLEDVRSQVPGSSPGDTHDVT